MSESTTVTEYAVRVDTGPETTTDLGRHRTYESAARAAATYQGINPRVVRRHVTTTRWEPVTGEGER